MVVQLQHNLASVKDCALLKAVICLQAQADLAMLLMKSLTSPQMMIEGTMPVMLNSVISHPLHSS